MKTIMLQVNERAWSGHAHRRSPPPVGPEGEPLSFPHRQPEPHFFLGSYDAIKRNYLPEDYLRDSSGHNVLTTVHCEAEMDRTSRSPKRGG
jgi:predicted TIM-barrel fold metal-dependent hydrolase